MNVINEIFDEFKLNRAKIEMSIPEMKSYLAPFADNIVLYGAGSSGIAFLYDLKKIDIIPRYFVDANQDKIGHICEGLEIIPINEIKRRISGDFLVIVCINTDGIRYCKSFDDALRTGGHHAVYDKLYGAGCKNVIDYTFFRHCFQIFKEEKYNAPSCSDVELMTENEDKIAEVYNMLDDLASKEIYEKIVKFRLIDDTLKVPTMTQDEQYFESFFYKKREDAIFVDCGAYNGISAKKFFEVNGNEYGNYYGIEPDEKNYTEIENYRLTLPELIKSKFNIYKCAVAEKEKDTKLYALGGPGSFIADDTGNQEIKTTTIDELLKGDKATYIKMNIEGSEKEALIGAERTIKEYKPQLAIAGYHRTDDLWEIPMAIKSYRNDYRLYLRSYMNHISFVYYAE